MAKPVTTSHKKSHDEPLDDAAPPLPRTTAKQDLAIQELLAGGTDAAAAKAAGVSRATVCRWRHGNADFIAALGKGRQDLRREFKDALVSLLPEAIAALRDGLADDAVMVRVRVAETIIRAMRTLGDSPGQTNPEGIRTAWRSERADLELQALFAR